MRRTKLWFTWIQARQDAKAGCSLLPLRVDTSRSPRSRRVFRTLKEEAEKNEEKLVRPFVLYDLRHSFLTRLGESGCDVWTSARIAGHSNIKQSCRYVHRSDDA